VHFTTVDSNGTVFFKPSLNQCGITIDGVQARSRWSEIADFQSIFTRSASVHYALSNEPKMNIVRCP